MSESSKKTTLKAAKLCRVCLAAGTKDSALRDLFDDNNQYILDALKNMFDIKVGEQFH